jgi:Tfp pilus assembly protein PilN
MKMLILLLTVAVIFGGKGFFRRWQHKRRMRRNDRFKKKQEAEYKRRFAENQAEIEKWRRESERKERNNIPKNINVTCKNPILAPLFEGVLLR